MKEESPPMPLLVASLPGNEACARSLLARLDAKKLDFELRRFPDGETFVRIDTDCRDCNVAIVASLDRPDDKFLPLHYLAMTARELGARHVTLVAPYLAYMRQDTQFAAGEAVTSRHFAALLGSTFDALVTVDPHLHRYESLDDLYTIPTSVVHAAPHIAAWVRDRVQAPLFVGPDSESEQWVAAVAALADAPHVVLSKVRYGDRDVEVTVPQIERWKDCTPVLVDDIVSTARTMAQTVLHLREAGMKPAICIGVHAVFADRAYDTLQTAGPAAIVTTNTIAHPTNAIDVCGAIADRMEQISRPDLVLTVAK